MGYGEGGLIALYSAAVDTRIDAAVVSGYFQPREGLWQEPVYRNVWGLLREFGDAELAGLVAPRTLMIEASRGPQVIGPPPSGREFGTGAAPGNLSGPLMADVQREYDRARPVFEKLRAGRQFLLITDQRGRDEPGSPTTIAAFLQALGGTAANRAVPVSTAGARPNFDSTAAEQRLFEQLIAFTQKILRQSESAREQFWSKADTSSLENWKRSREFYRQQLWEEIFGKLPPPSEPMKVQTRQWRKQARWTAHEVLLPLWPEVFAYGVLLVPNDLKPGERRPAVVTQHGRAGRPVDLIEPASADTERVYKRLAVQLADQGFIVYAPQNPYIFEEQYRYVQRKANPLKLSLFSFILSQHQRTLDWLSGLPFVDPSRIAYYGLSYGGKTAVRVPPLLDKYALSICSADFNEYSGKMAAIDRPDSFMYTIEHEMYEFNLANTFNYSDMVRLMAPRGFMVERGHNDSVGLDKWVAYEYEKVRRWYGQLGIPQRTEIEFFDGGHEIHGVGTFRFLHEQLKWPGDGRGR
jgi:cephalosporin-C deacetylase-like acetyl esterase